MPGKAACRHVHGRALQARASRPVRLRAPAACCCHALRLSHGMHVKHAAVPPPLTMSRYKLSAGKQGVAGGQERFRVRMPNRQGMAMAAFWPQTPASRGSRTGNKRILSLYNTFGSCDTSSSNANEQATEANKHNSSSRTNDGHHRGATRLVDQRVALGEPSEEFGDACIVAACAGNAPSGQVAARAVAGGVGGRQRRRWAAPVGRAATPEPTVAT